METGYLLELYWQDSNGVITKTALRIYRCYEEAKKEAFRLAKRKFKIDGERYIFDYDEGTNMLAAFVYGDGVVESTKGTILREGYLVTKLGVV